MIQSAKPLSYLFSKKAILILIGVVLLGYQLKVSASDTPSSPLEIQPSSSGLIFHWYVDPSSLQSSVLDLNSEVVNRLNLPDFIDSDAPGEYVMPEQSHLIVLPDDAAPDFEIVSSAEIELAADHPPEISPLPFGVKTSPSGAIIGGDYQSAPEPDQTTGRPVIQFEEIGRLGGARLGRITFTPISFDSATQEYTFVTDLKVAFDYGASAPLSSLRSGANSLTRLGEVLQEQVVNPGLLVGKGQVRERNFQIAETVSPPRPNLVLEIDQPGLFEITYADLLAISPNQAAMNPINWQLAKEGAPVDMVWVGDGDAVFEANERFLFYAPPSSNRWSTSEFYTLTSGTTAGSRMAAAFSGGGSLPVGKLRVTKVYEQDNSYTPNCFCGQLPAGRDGDRWIWDELRVPGNPAGTYPLELANADISNAEPAELTLWMIGFTDLKLDNDHSLSIMLDDTLLGTVIWDGKAGITHTVAIPAGRLTSTSQLKLALSETASPIDGVWLDAFSITYSKNTAAVSPLESHLFAGKANPSRYAANLSQPGWAFDVTVPNRPKLIGSGPTFVLMDSAPHQRYFVAEESAVATPRMRKATPFVTHHANLLMIGPAEFQASLAPLIQLRQSQGWTVGFVSVEEIYDSYGYGYPSPFAIQAALQDAYDFGAVRPEAVILVGDGTYDPKKNDANGKDTFVPVMFADVDPWIGEIPADNRYGTLDGDDILPDLLIGRFPVNNVEELQSIVNKLVAYPKQNFHWRKDVAFIADDNDKAGAFSAFVSVQSPNLSNSIFSLSSIQYSGLESELPQIRSKIGKEFDQGNGHLIYVGHSTVHQWADENFMHISEVKNLTNQTRLPIILQMTCFTSSFHMTGLDSFDEDLLRHPTGGAIGVWGATGLSVTTGHESLATGYLKSLALNNGAVVGEAIVAGKIKMMTDKPHHADLVDAYTFLGDPTLILAEPAFGIKDVFLPLMSR